MPIPRLGRSLKSAYPLSPMPVRALTNRGFAAIWKLTKKKLDEALKNSIEDVRYLFGYDADNDVLIDDGVAYQVFKQIDPYIQRGGIFSTRTNGLAAQIKTNKEKIARYDKALEKKRAGIAAKIWEYGRFIAEIAKAIRYDHEFQ